MKMKISEFKRLLLAIDECDVAIKGINIHGACFKEINGYPLEASDGLKLAFKVAIIQRRASMLDQLKAAGVNVDEVV